MKISEFQKMIKEIYYEKDKKRGIDGTFRWMIEEIGELARGIKKNDRKKLEEEIADIFAWFVSIANLLNIDVEKCIKEKYLKFCPRCKKAPCKCKE